VIGQRLGVLVGEWDASGGIDPSAASAWLSRQSTGPLIGTVRQMGIHDGLTVETTLDRRSSPSSTITRSTNAGAARCDGIEAFTELATLLLPGWHVEAVEDVAFSAPFKFYRNEPRSVYLTARLRAVSDTIVADCQLVGTRHLPSQPQPQRTTHFTARVRLAGALRSRGGRRSRIPPTAPR